MLARDSTGHLFNVEVQVLRYPRWSARSTFYLARMLSTQIDAGQHYLALKPAVGVHLLDFDLVEGHPSALWQFEMRDRHHPSVRLGDELTLFVVEFPRLTACCERGLSRVVSTPTLTPTLPPPSKP